MRKARAVIVMSVALTILFTFPVFGDGGIAKAQAKLKELGYDPGAVDGVWGSKTKTAIEQFQTHAGLTVNGQLDPQTKEKLGIPEMQEPLSRAGSGMAQHAAVKSPLVLSDIKILRDKASSTITFTKKADGTVSSEGRMGTVPAKDYPNERVVLDNAFHDGAEHSIVGKITGIELERAGTWGSGPLGFSGYVFDGDSATPLRFRCVAGKGYVYQSGKGTVVLKNGSEIRLGTAENGASAEALPGPSKEAPVISSEQVSGNGIEAAVSDSTLFKLLLLDKGINFVGVEWEQREQWGVGHSALDKEMKRIEKKYGFSMPTKEQDLVIDLPEPIQGDGAWQSGKGWGYLNLPDGWHEIVHLKDWGRLPKVEYAGGNISVDLSDIKVTISDKTTVKVGNKEYEYSKDSLIPKASKGK